MAALDANALILEYANVEVGDDSGSLVDLGSFRDVRIETRSQRVTIPSDNRGDILDRARQQLVMSGTWLEPGDVNKLENLFKGLVTKSSTAGSAVSGATQAVASGSWNYENLIFIENQNNDLSEITINSVSAGSDGSLTEGTDYFKVKDPATGKWGIIIYDSVTLTTESQALTINYDYTPAASLNLAGGSSGQTATPRYIKLTAPSEDSSTTERIVIMESAIVESEMLWEFVNVEEAGKVGEMPITAATRKGTAWSITDEINAS